MSAAFANVGDGGSARDIGAPEVASKHPTGVERELPRERLVESEIVAESGNRRRVGPLAHHLLDWIAWGDIEKQKAYDEHSGQRRHRQQQPAPQEPHERTLVAVATSVDISKALARKIAAARKVALTGCRH